jgi:hypothetical protein
MLVLLRMLAIWTTHAAFALPVIALAFAKSAAATLLWWASLGLAQNPSQPFDLNLELAYLFFLCGAYPLRNREKFLPFLCVPIL